MADEPELEVHSIEASEDSGVMDFACSEDIKKFGIAAAPNTTIATAHSESEDDEEESSLRYWNVQLDQSLSWSDNDDFSAEMRNSIISIRQEASRVDALLREESSRMSTDALEEDFRNTRRQLHCKTTQVEELKAMLAESEMAVGQLELERDLYKADAEKFKTDLARLAESIRELDSSSVETIVPEQPTAHNNNNTNDHRPLSEHTICPPPSAASSDLSMSASEDGSEITYKSGRKSKTRGFLKNMVRRRTKTLPLSQTVSCSMDFSGVTTTCPQEVLQDRFVASLETAEELRRRLAMVSIYYENLVRRLQDNLVQEKTQRTRMQADLVHQISQLSTLPGDWSNMRKSSTM